MGVSLLNAMPSWAQTAATGDGFVWRDYQEPVVRPDQPLWLQAFWFLVKLGFVVGLIYATLLLYKRMLGQRSPVDFTSIRVLETSRLAGTQSLYKVQVDDKVLLLGSNGAGLLTKLAEWPASEIEGDFNTVIESSLRRAVVAEERSPNPPA
jgi:flagellar biogenesis protein FliO